MMAMQKETKNERVNKDRPVSHAHVTIVIIYPVGYCSHGKTGQARSTTYTCECDKKRKERDKPSAPIHWRMQVHTYTYTTYLRVNSHKFQVRRTWLYEATMHARTHARIARTRARAHTDFRYVGDVHLASQTLVELVRGSRVYACMLVPFPYERRYKEQFPKTYVCEDTHTHTTICYECPRRRSFGGCLRNRVRLNLPRLNYLPILLSRQVYPNASGRAQHRILCHICILDPGHACIRKAQVPFFSPFICTFSVSSSVRSLIILKDFVQMLKNFFLNHQRVQKRYPLYR